MGFRDSLPELERGVLEVLEQNVVSNSFLIARRIADEADRARRDLTADEAKFLASVLALTRFLVELDRARLLPAESFTAKLPNPGTRVPGPKKAILPEQPRTATQDEFRRTVEWLRANRAQYAGQHVALKGGLLVLSDASREGVVSALRGSGVEGATVMFVSQRAPDVGGTIPEDERGNDGA